MTDFDNTNDDAGQEFDDLIGLNGAEAKAAREARIEAQRTGEVDQVLANVGTTRDAVGTATATTTEKGPNEAPSLMDLISSKQLADIRMLGATKHIDVAIESRKVMQCEIDGLSKKAAAEFIAYLEKLPVANIPGIGVGAVGSSEQEQTVAAKAAAVTNSEQAGQAVASDMVPEFGTVMKKFEPTALAFGFPPAVDALIERAKLSPEQTSQLLSKFADLFSQINSWKTRLDAIVITGPEDKEAIAEAKELHKAIRDDRLNSEKKKKIVKEPYLRPGQLIDGVFKVYIDETTPLEAAALAKAKYIENLEIAAKEKIRSERVEQLKPYVENILAFNLHPDVMTDEAFGTVLSTQKELHANREERRLAEEQAERIRLDNEAAERVLIRRKSERTQELSAMGFVRDEAGQRYILEDLSVYDNEIANDQPESWTARVDALRPKAEAARLEAERKKREGEAAIKSAAQKRLDDEAAALAPDKDKLERLAVQIEAISFPDVANDRTRQILGDAKSGLYQVVAKLRSELKQLP